MMPATWIAPALIDLPDARTSSQDVRRAPSASVATNDLSTVRIDDTRATPVPVSEYEQAVVADCLERMSMLARHRDERPTREHPRIHARLLAHLDALAAAGATIAEVLRFWEDESADDPWATWTTAFVLGCSNGPRGLEALQDIAKSLPSDARNDGLLTADALLLTPHPARVDLARDLAHSPSPIARVIGIDLLSRLGVSDPSEELAATDDATIAVRATALSALARRPSLGDALPRVRACLRDEDAAVAWEAARALTLSGQRDAIEAVRAGDELAERLGARALEILVMAGSPEDLPLVERLTKRLPMTPEVLSTVARFGHPAAWPYLVHGLGRAEIADVAERALATIFGPIVDDTAADTAAAWRAGLSCLEIPASARWRRGDAWSADVVRAECASGELARREVEQREDELRAARAFGGVEAL